MNIDLPDPLNFRLPLSATELNELAEAAQALDAQTTRTIDLHSPDYIVNISAPHANTQPQRRNFECIYIRPVGERFELVIQWVVTIDTDFTFDEEVLATSDTPLALIVYFASDTFQWPVPPSLRDQVRYSNAHSTTGPNTK